MNKHKQQELDDQADREADTLITIAFLIGMLLWAAGMWSLT